VLGLVAMGGRLLDLGFGRRSCRPRDRAVDDPFFSLTLL
jgi:hypothetical protein